MVGQLLGNRKRSETGIKNLNHLLQKARFTFQALLEFDRRVCGSVNSIHDLGQGDALHCCSCPVHRAQNFNGFTGPISRAVSVTGVRAHMKLESDTGSAVSRGRRMVRECGCLHMFPGIRDEMKIYSLPADCSNLFSAPYRGSFGASNSYALWPFGPPREPSQLMCFLMPCIASNFPAMSFFLFRIYSESYSETSKA